MQTAPLSSSGQPRTPPTGSRVSNVHHKFSSGDDSEYTEKPSPLGSLLLRWDANNSGGGGSSGGGRVVEAEPLRVLGTSILRSFGSSPAQLEPASRAPNVGASVPNMVVDAGILSSEKNPLFSANSSSSNVSALTTEITSKAFAHGQGQAALPFSFDLPQALKALQGFVGGNEEPFGQEEEETKTRPRRFSFGGLKRNRGPSSRSSSSASSADSAPVWRPVPLGQRLLNSVLIQRQQGMDTSYINMVARLLRGNTKSIARFQDAVDDFRGDDSYSASDLLDEMEALFYPRDLARVVAPLVTQIPEAEFRKELRDELLRRQGDLNSMREAGEALAVLANATLANAQKISAAVASLQQQRLLRTSSTSQAATQAAAKGLFAPPGSPGGGFRSSEVQHSPLPPAASSFSSSSLGKLPPAPPSPPLLSTEKSGAARSVTVAAAAAAASAVSDALLSGALFVLSAMEGIVLGSGDGDGEASQAMGQKGHYWHRVRGGFVASWLSSWLPSAVLALEQRKGGGRRGLRIGGGDGGGGRRSKSFFGSGSGAGDLALWSPPKVPMPTWKPPRSLPRSTNRDPSLPRAWVPPEGLSWAPTPVLEALEGVEKFFATVAPPPQSNNRTAETKALSPSSLVVSSKALPPPLGKVAAKKKASALKPEQLQRATKLPPVVEIVDEKDSSSSAEGHERRSWFGLKRAEDLAEEDGGSGVRTSFVRNFLGMRPRRLE